jgi:phosphoserine phosphatase
MSSNQQLESFHIRLRRLGAMLRTLGTTPARLLGWLADSVSTPNSRRGRRQMRRWLEANGLTIVLVSAMMVVAWMIAAR